MRNRTPSLKLLDVGAGSGTISVAFAEMVPEGQVIATDLNPDILVRAQGVAESHGTQNITFQAADVYNLPYEDETFDVVHCHQVLYQLKEPVNALREMLRVTRPGGIVAAREGDVESECVWPEVPGLLKFHTYIGKTIESAGGCTTAGRQLLSWALKAGAKRDRITATFGTWCYSELADKEVWGMSYGFLANIF